jgi:hypothetical protein
MKLKMTVITDKSGEFLGAVRSDPVRVGKNTFQPSISPHPDQTCYQVEVDEEVFSMPHEEARALLLGKISGK